MYVQKPNQRLEEKFVNIVSSIAREQEAADGKISLVQQDIINKSEGLLRNITSVTGVMNYFKEQGLIDRLERGTAAAPSKWDVSKLLSEYDALPQKTVDEKAKQIYNVTTSEQKEVVQEIQSTLSSMMEYIRSIPNELLEPIQHFQEQVEGLDGGKAKDLQSKLERLESDYQYLEGAYTKTQQELQKVTKDKDVLNEGINLKETEILNLRKELQRASTEHTSIQEILTKRDEEIANLKRQLENKGPEFNPHTIYRSRNFVIDEMERFLAQPGWARKGKEGHLRMVVHNHLDNILRELKIEEPTY